mgnify:FL=1
MLYDEFRRGYTCWKVKNKKELEAKFKEQATFVYLLFKSHNWLMLLFGCGLLDNFFRRGFLCSSLLDDFLGGLLDDLLGYLLGGRLCSLLHDLLLCRWFLCGWLRGLLHCFLCCCCHWV